MSDDPPVPILPPPPSSQPKRTNQSHSSPGEIVLKRIENDVAENSSSGSLVGKLQSDYYGGPGAETDEGGHDDHNHYHNHDFNHNSKEKTRTTTNQYEEAADDELAFELDSLADSYDELVMPLAPNESIQRENNNNAERTGYAVWRSVFWNLVYIVLWYSFSMCLSLYNKWMMGSGEGQRNFKYPFLLTTVHFVAQFVFSSIVIYCFPSLRPKVRISWRDYFLRVVPSGIATSIDIGLSNLSFKYITLTFYTMCKSSSPIFLLIFAFLFKLEKVNFTLIGIVLLITAGIILAVMGETSFDIKGFTIIMFASVFAGLRWTVTQILLQKEKLGMTNPFATLYYISPVMAGSLFIISLSTEKIWEIPSSPSFATPDDAVETILLIVAGAVLAFFMVTSEFQLIRETSAITFTVAGIVKEVLVIIMAVIIFEDQLGPANIFGLVLVILGVSLYNFVKYRKMKQAMAEAQRYTTVPREPGEEGVEFLSMKTLKAHNAAMRGGGH